MTKITATAMPALATRYAATTLCGLDAVGRFSGSWRGVSGASAFASVTQVDSAAAGRLNTTVNTHAPQAMKRHMIRKNGVKGSSPWRVPV